MVPIPWLRNGQALRITSPSGDSTLITSAPKSPRICVAYGPMTTVVKSRTRTPARGPKQISLLKNLFWLDSGELGELRPMRDLGLDEAAELSRSHRRRVDADAGVFFLHLRFGQALDGGVVQLLHDFLRRLCRGHEREPCDQLIARQLLGYGRHIGRQRGPRF